MKKILNFLTERAIQLIILLALLCMFFLYFIGVCIESNKPSIDSIFRYVLLLLLLGLSFFGFFKKYKIAAITGLFGWFFVTVFTSASSYLSFAELAGTVFDFAKSSSGADAASYVFIGISFIFTFITGIGLIVYILMFLLHKVGLFKKQILAVEPFVLMLIIGLILVDTLLYIIGEAIAKDFSFTNLTYNLCIILVLPLMYGADLALNEKIPDLKITLPKFEKEAVKEEHNDDVESKPVETTTKEEETSPEDSSTDEVTSVE